MQGLRSGWLLHSGEKDAGFKASLQRFQSFLVSLPDLQFGFVELTQRKVVLHSAAEPEGLEDMSSMEPGGPASQGQPQQTQQQGTDGATPQLNPQDQARAASLEALEAQQKAQEAIKRAYVKQMAAQEKSGQASQQAVVEQEMAIKVATQAATEAAEKATKEQRERASKEVHDTSIAQEAAHTVLASFSANQPGNQQGPSAPSYQSGFVPYSPAVHNAPIQPQGQQGAVQQGQPQPVNQDSDDAMRSAQRCQKMLLQGANQMAQNATARMTAAQNLAASAPDAQNQQMARVQAEVAQNQMTMAYQIAAAAQAPDTALQAAAALPNLFNAT